MPGPGPPVLLRPSPARRRPRRQPPAPAQPRHRPPADGRGAGTPAPRTLGPADRRLPPNGGVGRVGCGGWRARRPGRQPGASAGAGGGVGAPAGGRTARVDGRAARHPPRGSGSVRGKWWWLSARGAPREADAGPPRPAGRRAARARGRRHWQCRDRDRERPDRPSTRPSQRAGRRTCEQAPRDAWGPRHAGRRRGAGDQTGSRSAAARPRRSCATAFVWIWQTRLSVTPSTSPISARVRPSW